jgi:hypothetical protein
MNRNISDMWCDRCSVYCLYREGFPLGKPSLNVVPCGTLRSEIYQALLHAVVQLL